MEQKKRVKCVDTRGSYVYLTVGNIYEVLEEDILRYAIVNDDNKVWPYLKQAFEVVTEHSEPQKELTTQEFEVLESMLSGYESKMFEAISESATEESLQDVIHIAKSIEIARQLVKKFA